MTARLPRLRIGARFGLVLGLLVVGTVALGVVALQGNADLHRNNDQLVETVTELDVARRTEVRLAEFAQHLQLYLMTGSPELEQALQEDVAAVEQGLAEQKRLFSDDARELELTGEEERPYRAMLELWRSPEARDALDRARETPLLAELRKDAQEVFVAGEALAKRAEQLTLEAEEQSEASFGDTRELIVLVLLAIAVAGLGIALWLIRSVVPRTRRYAEFAERVARGDLEARLPAREGDELDQLGLTLNEMVETRARQAETEEDQAEFNDALQVAGSEEEAHTVLKLHLERSIDGGEAAVLNRNNSDDRLELKTTVSEGSPLPEATSGAEPRACLAIRHARTHVEGDGLKPPLVPCKVCGGVPGTKTCSPLLVGGEVIGSVLVATEQPLAEPEEERLQQSIVQAAPVLANLRNLAIAELRAATDALTGLPNNRSVRDTLKRMVAQAGRTKEPLAAALLDLDHFKKINDTFGHGKGDDALAAVGAILRETVRESDFVGRMGGEEFLLLLPGTDAEGAIEVCEKLRQAVARQHVPGIERDITASFGVAVIPHHAGDAESLLREADRALYAAKEAGRDRVELAHPSEAAQQHALDDA